MMDFSIGLDLATALLTSLYLGKLLVERAMGGEISFEKRSLLNQNISKRTVALPRAA